MYIIYEKIMLNNCNIFDVKIQRLKGYPRGTPFVKKTITQQNIYKS